MYFYTFIDFFYIIILQLELKVEKEERKRENEQIQVIIFLICQYIVFMLFYELIETIHGEGF